MCQNRPAWRDSRRATGSSTRYEISSRTAVSRTLSSGWSFSRRSRRDWLSSTAARAFRTTRSNGGSNCERRREPHRPEALVLLPRPARRRALLPGLPGAAHLPAVPEDGRRARTAHRRAAADTGRLSLGEPCVADDGGRGAGAALPRDAARPRHAWRHARADLREGAEPDPGPGQAAPVDRRADRPGGLVGDGRRREGRRLRGTAGEECPGRQGGRAAVLHAAGGHPGDGRLRAAAARRSRRGSGVRHGWLPARRPRVSQAQRRPGSRPEAASPLRGVARRGTRPQRRAAA